MNLNIEYSPAMSISMAIGISAKKSCYRHFWISFLEIADSVNDMSPESNSENISWIRDRYRSLTKMIHNIIGRLYVPLKNFRPCKISIKKILEYCHINVSVEFKKIKIFSTLEHYILEYFKLLIFATLNKQNFKKMNSMININLH